SVVEAVEHDARPLRVLRAADSGRADEVGEKYCRELALLRRLRRPPDGRRAGRTEASVGRKPGSALGTGRHMGIVTPIAGRLNLATAGIPGRLEAELPAFASPDPLPSSRLDRLWGAFTRFSHVWPRPTGLSLARGAAPDARRQSS